MKKIDTKNLAAGIATFFAAMLCLSMIIKATAFSAEAELSMNDTEAASSTVVTMKLPAPAAAATTAIDAKAGTEEPKPVKPRTEKPQRLIIPSLNIDANVQHVGIGRSGNMAVPSNYTDVGWYRYGTIPGNIGSAVFDGHIDNGLSLPGVFKELHAISKGADIFIVNEKGERIRFTVTEASIYDHDDPAASQRIFNDSGGALIRLITCTGDWIQGEKTYANRLIVTAKLAQ